MGMLVFGSTETGFARARLHAFKSERTARCALRVECDVSGEKRPALPAENTRRLRRCCGPCWHRDIPNGLGEHLMRPCRGESSKQQECIAHHCPHPSCLRATARRPAAGFVNVSGRQQGWPSGLQPSVDSCPELGLTLALSLRALSCDQAARPLLHSASTKAVSSPSPDLQPAGVSLTALAPPFWQAFRPPQMDPLVAASPL